MVYNFAPKFPAKPVPYMYIILHNTVFISVHYHYIVSFNVLLLMLLASSYTVYLGQASPSENTTQHVIAYIFLKS